MWLSMSTVLDTYCIVLSHCQSLVSENTTQNTAEQ